MSKPWRCAECGGGYPCVCRIEASLAKEEEAQVSAMPERVIKAYVSKERIEVPHPNPLIATYVYDGEPRAPDEVEGWIVIAPHSEPPVPESRLLAAEARAKAMEDGPLDYMSGKCDRLKEQNAALRADLDALVPLARLGLWTLDVLAKGKDGVIWNTIDFDGGDVELAAWGFNVLEGVPLHPEQGEWPQTSGETAATTQARAILAREAGE